METVFVPKLQLGNELIYGVAACFGRVLLTVAVALLSMTSRDGLAAETYTLCDVENVLSSDPEEVCVFEFEEYEEYCYAYITATSADPGYAFDRWDVAVTPLDGGDTQYWWDSSNPMTVDTGWVAYDLTAVFVPAAFTVYATTEHTYGDVAIVPEKYEFDYGEAVVLTANPMDHWQFDRWEITKNAEETWESTTNPFHLTIDGDYIFKAHLEGGAFTVTISLDDPEQGTVEVVPDLDTYEYGQVVSLEAQESEGWLFVRWEGIYDWVLSDKAEHICGFAGFAS